jgi:hypothetical protein
MIIFKREILFYLSKLQYVLAGGMASIFGWL